MLALPHCPFSIFLNCTNDKLFPSFILQTQSSSSGVWVEWEVSQRDAAAAPSMCPVDHFKHHRKHACILKPAVLFVLDSLLTWLCITECIILHFSQIHSPPKEQDGVIWDLTQVGREALPETK